jgi:plastocyanin
LKSRITFHAGKININLTFISFLVLPFFVFYYESFIVYAQEEIITMVPGSSDSSRFRFFDITEYPISTGEEIKWYNADDIMHNIVITTNDGKTIVTQSKDIKPKGFFSFTFDDEGEYLFQSSKYDWMKGKIIVTSDIKTIKKSMENDIDLYLSWTPSSSINIGEKVFFKIIFVDKKSEKNQEHIDYSFTIENPTSDRVVYKNVGHSAWGVEPASYVFDSSGTFIGKLRIEGILFQPIKPDQTEFEITIIK